MTDYCDLAIAQFLEIIKTEFETVDLDDRCSIVTPFYYPDFAAIELFVQQVGDGVLLTDEGETLNMLFLNGLTIENNKVLYKEAKRIATMHGVELQDSEISVISSPNTLGEASQKILSAIQAIAYLIYKRRNIEHATFDDEVEKLFIFNEVKYDFNYSIQGRANIHKVKFHVNSNKNLLVEPVSAVTIQGARNKAKLIAYKWLDIRQVNKTLRFVSIIDDRDQKWDNIWADDEARNAIYTHSDEVIRWSTEQPKLIDMLVSK